MTDKKTVDALRELRRAERQLKSGYRLVLRLLPSDETAELHEVSPQVSLDLSTGSVPPRQSPVQAPRTSVSSLKTVWSGTDDRELVTPGASGSTVMPPVPEGRIAEPLPKGADDPFYVMIDFKTLEQRQNAFNQAVETVVEILNETDPVYQTVVDKEDHYTHLFDL